MPIYEFKCTKCERIFEQVRNLSRRDKKAQCPDCYHPAKRILSMPSLQRNLGLKLRNKLDRKERG